MYDIIPCDKTDDIIYCDEFDDIICCYEIDGIIPCDCIIYFDEVDDIIFWKPTFLHIVLVYSWFFLLEQSLNHWYNVNVLWLLLQIFYDKKVVVSSSPVRIRVCQQFYSEKWGRCSLSEILAITSDTTLAITWM